LSMRARHVASKPQGRSRRKEKKKKNLRLCFFCAPCVLAVSPHWFRARICARLQNLTRLQSFLALKPSSCALSSFFSTDMHDLSKLWPDGTPAPELSASRRFYALRQWPSKLQCAAVRRANPRRSDTQKKVRTDAGDGAGAGQRQPFSHSS